MHPHPTWLALQSQIGTDPFYPKLSSGGVARTIETSDTRLSWKANSIVPSRCCHGKLNLSPWGTDVTETKPKRRWLSFSIRDLLWLTIVVALCVAWGMTLAENWRLKEPKADPDIWYSGPPPIIHGNNK